MSFARRRGPAGVIGVSMMLIVAGACGDGGTSRSDAMEAVASELAVPAFTGLQDRAGGVSQAITSACEQPAEPPFDAVVEAVDGARTAWYESEAVWVGPVMNRRSSGVVDWPINKPEIAELLLDSTPGDLTAEYLGRSVGADDRGFGAIEWVASAPAELTEVDRVVRCDYLSGLAEVISTEFDLVVSDWTESFDGGPPYADVFAGEGEGGVDEQVDMVVNDTLGTLESMKDEPDAPTPAVQAARLRGLRRLYAGQGEDFAGLSPLLGDELAARLTSELDAAIAAYDESDVAAGASAATDVQRTVATEVVSRLGVTVGFSDADGDGGT